MMYLVTRSLKLLLFTLLTTTSFAQQNYIDSLQNQLKQTSDDRRRIKILVDLAFEYAYSKPDSALILGQTAYLLSERLNDPLKQALSLNRIAGAYVATGKYAKALQLFRKARIISEGIGDVEGIHRSLNNIGDMYMEQKDWSQALLYFRQAQSIRQKKVNWSSQSVELENIGECYLNMQRSDSVLRYEQRAFELAKKADAGTEGDILRIMGNAELQRHNEAAALEDYRNSIAYNKKYRDSLDLSRTYLAMGLYFDEINQKDSAIYYTHLALSTASSGHYLKGIFEANKQLAAFYEHQNHYRQALQYYKHAVDYNDSLFGPRKIKEMVFIDFEEKQRLQDIEVARREERNRIKWQVSLAISAMFLLLVIILYRNNQDKQKVNVLLQQQKEQIQKSLEVLKSTQAQLIQSEKMASLGELMAGIAHEIQNPLNFVNNFSEVGTELIAEMKHQLKSGNEDEAVAIADELEENLQKIDHHGKRADAIVKNMLQHSRASSGKKELTDINALADEYLRLSYNGFRAKDKDFNATIETEFDESIGKIEVVPQDIGRVLLNMYNNAFYAVNVKQKAGGESYRPIVKVQTKKVDSKVQIIVHDNRTGIPQKAVDKIFQPFFTTKPTGQGTGLGLSLSYDIIKAHGGEIKVESKESEGSEFIIHLLI